MFFRNELTETMNTLKLTQELENALKSNGAKGNSISDMVKSYQILDKEDFDEDYEFRAYKRELLDGRYNGLRWIAHERNQIMHQNKYLISNYTMFKYKIKDAIKYIKSGCSDIFTYESFILGLFKAVPYLVPIIFIIFAFKDKLVFEKINILTIIIGFVFLGLAIRFGELISVITNIFYDIYNFIQKIATNNKILFYTLILSYLLWDKDSSYLYLLMEKTQEFF